MDRIEEVSLAIDFIEANLTERLNLDRIADAVHYSKYHLHRVFSDTVGLTVHEYMKRRQLTESAKLLILRFCRATGASRHLRVHSRPCIKCRRICTGKTNGFIRCSLGLILKGVMRC